MKFKSHPTNENPKEIDKGELSATRRIEKEVLFILKIEKFYNEKLLDFLKITLFFTFDWQRINFDFKFK